MTRVLLSVLMLLFYYAPPARAGDPLPQSKAQALKAVQDDLEHERRQQEQLTRKLEGIGSELEGTRAAMVALAEDIQTNERSLSALETRMEAFALEKRELDARLEQDYAAIAGLVLALERMRRIPPESLIVRPGTPLKTAQSAMLLRGTLPAVNARATQLSRDLERLATLTASLEKDMAQALAHRSALTEKQASMQALADKREKLYSSTQGDLARHRKTVERLAREAGTLQELLAGLDRENLKRQAGEDTRKADRIYGKSPPASGDPRLPVAGVLSVGFRQRNAIGAVSQGLSIESRPGALVVAPMGGVVRYAGPFRNYGKMVIIERRNGYHSLIGGLDKITTSEGSGLKAGEPVGQLALPSSRSGNPELYYELRFKGQPVNPAGKFSELKS